MGLAVGLALCATPVRADPPEQVLLEFHLDPTADLQIAIWLEDADGNFIDDVFVTQSTGTLGIGNRSGLPLFLSSWRAPYGPREGVLPVWAHRRGKTYPKIVFFDASQGDQVSQGYHEPTSSPETYFCRPLTPEEDEAIIDTMTCPSPSTFNTDKGRFHASETSVYPPRNDLNGAHSKDSPDVAFYAELNELDAVSGATPSPGPFMVAHQLARDVVPEGPLIAWVEVSRERDENESWDFDRDTDHALDAAVPLQHFGREFLGQPSVLYRVEFDPAADGFFTVEDYAGYGDLYGDDGDLAPPDATISTSEGSGADRLQIYERFGSAGRFGVFSHGWGNAAPTNCAPAGTIPAALEELELVPLDFDRVRVRFRMPSSDGARAARFDARWITPQTDSFEPGAGTAAMGVPRVCAGPVETDCVQAEPGGLVEFEIDQLFGNYSYTVAVSYEDACTNRSALAVDHVTTPQQRFATIDSACFIATAAWGAGWTEELRALRWFRDVYMIDQPVAADLVRAYYAYGPVLAEMIRGQPAARAAARVVLRPIADLARALAAR